MKFGDYKLETNNYEIREEVLHDRKHIVVPVVMMKEGVHHGNQGPIYHSEDELSHITEAWNGEPVTVQHPSKNGESVSANSPEILEQYRVGTIFNAHYEDGLRADLWIDVDRIAAISPAAYQHILEYRPLDVSVGMFSDADPSPGEWNGETYDSVAHNYRPDHIALLPGGTGACSWSDGCGIRNNAEGGKMNGKIKSFKTLAEQGYAVKLMENEQGYREILESLQRKVDTMDTEDSYHFVVEVYDDYFIYRKRTLNGGGDSLYRQNYSIDGDDNITFSGGAVSVRQEISYVTNSRRTKPSVNKKSKGGSSMSTENKPCCEGKVDALIANKATRFTAVDKEWLQELSESQIDALEPKEPELQANAKEAIDTFKATLKSEDDFLGIMPANMANVFRKGMETYKVERENQIKTILENSAEGTFTKEALEALSDDVLKGIAGNVKKADEGHGATGPGSYAGMGNPPAPSGQGTGEPVMLPVGHIQSNKN